MATRQVSTCCGHYYFVNIIILWTLLFWNSDVSLISRIPAANSLSLCIVPGTGQPDGASGQVSLHFPVYETPSCHSGSHAQNSFKGGSAFWQYGVWGNLWSNLIWFHFYDEDAHIVFVIFIIGKTLENISKVTVYDCVSDGGFNGIFYLAVVLWDEHPTNFLPFLIDVFLHSFFCSHILITPLKWSPRWTLTHHEHYVK